MTTTHEQLAEMLIALNNSRPYLPSRAEIMEVLAKASPPQAEASGCSLEFRQIGTIEFNGSVLRFRNWRLDARHSYSVIGRDMGAIGALEVLIRRLKVGAGGAIGVDWG